MASKPFDPTVKMLVEISPGDWPVLLGQPAAPTEVIDADIATVTGAADKVLRVATAIPYLVHLEFQAGHDSATLPQLLHLRSTLLENRHGLLVRCAAVLLHPGADSPALTGERRLAFAGEAAYDVFRYQVVRVWQIPPATLLRGGWGLLALAPISAVTEADLPGIIKQMEARLRTRGLRKYAGEVWSAAFILTGLRFSRELAEQLFRGVRSMKESVTYQAILEEGEAKGRSEGAITEAKRFLLRLGQSRFGSPPAPVRAALESITEVDRFEALGERVPAVASWEELLGLSTPHGARSRRQPRT